MIRWSKQTSQAEDRFLLETEDGITLFRTAVGEAGVERGLASGGAPCCGRFHAATAHRYDCSVHTERQYFARISNAVVKCIS